MLSLTLKLEKTLSGNSYFALHDVAHQANHDPPAVSQNEIGRGAIGHDNASPHRRKK